ncbi:MAG: triphosphoribosyl-dephospho-CoA synthase, partial [Synergistaceae bacterium]|nr:triphosphoribosyl-dephospho-CoA synthase [Synergistaceae bacterium]
ATQGHLYYRERLTHTLITIMAENQDTSLAANGGIGELMRVQDEAKKALEAGGMITPLGTAAVLDMDKAIRSRGSSPSGSEVILACAVLIPELVNMRLTRSGYEE